MLATLATLKTLLAAALSLPSLPMLVSLPERLFLQTHATDMTTTRIMRRTMAAIKPSVNVSKGRPDDDAASET